MKEERTPAEIAGAYLRELRSETGLNTYKVAKSIGITGNYLGDLERGVKEPSETVIQALAEYYKIPLDKLFNMYGKTAPSETKYLLDNPMFRKTFIKLSIDENLTLEDRLEITKALNDVYESISKKKE